jgi:hypothetical protein
VQKFLKAFDRKRLEDICAEYGVTRSNYNKRKKECNLCVLPIKSLKLDGISSPKNNCTSKIYYGCMAKTFISYLVVNPEFLSLCTYTCHYCRNEKYIVCDNAERKLTTNINQHVIVRKLVNGNQGKLFWRALDLIQIPKLPLTLNT